MAALTPDRSFWSLHLTDLVQIMFWLVVASVTLLTYSHAKRTILQPLHTEVFKLQLETMNRLLKILVGKGEYELTSHFNLDGALEANTVKMMDAYVESQLGFAPKDPDSRPYSPKFCPSALADPKALEVVRYDNPTTTTGEHESDGEKTDWRNYEHLIVSIPREHSDAVAELESFLSDPLVPVGCAARVEALLEAVRESVQLVAPLLTERSQQLPDLYPTLEELRDRDFGGWIHNDWNKQRPTLLPLVSDIVAYARAYLGADAFRLSPARSQFYIEWPFAIPSGWGRSKPK